MVANQFLNADCLTIDLSFYPGYQNPAAYPSFLDSDAP